MYDGTGLSRVAVAEIFHACHRLDADSGRHRRDADAHPDPLDRRVAADGGSGDPHPLFTQHAAPGATRAPSGALDFLYARTLRSPRAEEDRTHSASLPSRTNRASRQDPIAPLSGNRKQELMGIPFIRSFEPDYGKLVRATPLISRIVANNPSPFTFKGTGVYIVGDKDVAVIDPGPDSPEHIEALKRALAGKRVTHILVTHCHSDHSPAAKPLKQWCGAKTYAFGPHGRARD